MSYIPSIILWIVTFFSNFTFVWVLWLLSVIYLFIFPTLPYCPFYTSVTYLVPFLITFSVQADILQKYNFYVLLLTSNLQQLYDYAYTFNSIQQR